MRKGEGFARFMERTDRIELAIAQVLMACIIVLVFIAALMRWTRHPVVWSVDIAQLLFVWACFLGADVVLFRSKHIGIEVLVAAFPSWLRKAWDIVICLMILAFLVFVGVTGAQIAEIGKHRMLSTIPISYSWAVISAPIGALLMMKTIVYKLYVLLSETPDVGRLADTALTSDEQLAIDLESAGSRSEEV